MISVPYSIKGTPKAILHKSVSRLLFNPLMRKKRKEKKSKEKRDGRREGRGGEGKGNLPKGLKLKMSQELQIRLVFYSKGPIPLGTRYFLPHLP